ncbi:DinB family protein [Limnoglobus roseus]|uniref:DinB-like domain-containing protein n=1 Tax=Limnoglobus roseus TaxID=2598579 RepID=A0A5C1AD54_9BACT|nr:DinB family protein [Limnoglobus roseus]QEL17289.1 hypothetical protein PX52LOC_04272 [Limnoglobus roseus]
MANSLNLTTFRFVLSHITKACADIPEEQMREQPHGVNPPVWILGHIITTTNTVLKVIGQPTVGPAEYRDWFGPNTKLDAMPAELPSKSQLLGHLSELSERILVEVSNLTEDDLTKPNTLGFRPEQLPTMRDVFEVLLFTHPMLHVGQLSTWRRLQGLPSYLVIAKK